MDSKVLLDMLDVLEMLNVWSGYSENINNKISAIRSAISEPNCEHEWMPNFDGSQICRICKTFIPAPKVKQDIVDEAKRLNDFDMKKFDESSPLYEKASVNNEAIKELEAENYKLQTEIVDAHNEQCKLEAELKKEKVKWDLLKRNIENAKTKISQDVILEFMAEIKRSRKGE